MTTLAYRRHQIRRRRHRLAHVVAGGAGWGVVVLATVWLILAGVYGLSNA